MQFDDGYLSPYMATESQTLEAVLDNPYILIYDKKISAMKDLIKILEGIAGESKPLVIICEDLEGEALATIVLNLIRGTIRVVAVKAPGFGDDQKQMLEDIAVLTGGKVISEDKGMRLDSVSLSDLGTAKRIKVDKEKTVIMEGGGDTKKIKARISLIESQVQTAKSDFDKDDLKKRLAKLAGGVAVIYVGAATETEMKEKKSRVDDAVNATRAAIEEGVIPGGGVALLKAIPELDKLNLPNDQKIGAEIIKRAIEEPTRQIAINSGKEGSVVVERLKKESGNIGYNAKKDVYEDLVKAGVIDPVKVTRTALQNAGSIAGMLLTTDALVVDIPEKKEEHPEMPQGMGGMGMM